MGLSVFHERAQQTKAPRMSAAPLPANKMRAYRLQNSGLDTRDANTTLGFEDDERDYGVAALMLRTFDYPWIVLLTNNPRRIDEGRYRDHGSRPTRSPHHPSQQALPDNKGSTIRAQTCRAQGIDQREILNSQCSSL